MHRPRLAIGFLLAPIAFTLVFMTLACSSSAPEQGLIDKFFRASKLRDAATMGNIAAGAAWDKNTDGVVDGFSVVSVSEETVAPLKLRELAQKYAEAQKESDELNKKKLAYQEQHASELKSLLDLERKGAAVKGKEAAFQVEWNKWREDTASIEKKVSEARTALQADRNVADTSVFNPMTPVDATQYDGEMATKTYTINANITTPDNQHVKKTLVITLQQARLTGDKPITGKWIITKIKDVTTGGKSS
jgi:hypothetical protein